MLVKTHMEELKEFTNEVIYENYRTGKLNSNNGGVLLGGRDGLAKFEQEKSNHQAKMAKMESEMKTVFQQKVAEKEAKLEASEAELYQRHKEMKEQLEKQRLELDDKKRKLESGGRNDANKPKWFK